MRQARSVLGRISTYSNVTRKLGITSVVEEKTEVAIRVRCLFMYVVKAHICAYNGLPQRKEKKAMEHVRMLEAYQNHR